MELPDVGNNCAFDGCSALDFLPMRCVHCGKSFCSKHGGAYSHSCPNAPERAVDDAERASRDSGTSNVPVSTYTRPERTGPKDIRADPKKALTDEQQAALLALRQSTAKQPQTALKSSSRSRSSPKIELMRLKAKAKGNASIDMKDRLYLSIRWKAKTINVLINKASRSVIGNAAGQFARQLGASMLPDTVYRLQ
ncbi:AN1-type zinc finger protein 1, partial [Coemansia sp. RSA 2599]